MKDEILKNFLDDFSKKYDLDEFTDDSIFERFVNFCIVSKEYPREFDIEDLSTGGADDLGIDGAAVIVNGNIINEEDEIEYFVNQNGNLDITFILIQSKTSSKFSGEQVGTFLYGVKSLFDEKKSIPENEKIEKLRLIKEKIYQNSINFEHAPNLKLYFATTGEWKDPEQIKSRAARELSEIEEKKLFQDKPSINFIDAEKLKLFYRELQRKIIKEISIPSMIPLPDFKDETKIKQALIGSVPVKSYLSIVESEDKQLLKGLFYDNIRDFQGNNSVNKEIGATLRSSIDQNILPLLNNGITIISKKLERTGNKIKLSDFQIVNGCQTTNVLYNNRDYISADTNIIIKIIETDDKDITNNIIRATNRQTEVKVEAFESIKTFHRDLQEYYKAKSTLIQFPIFYERRSKEFLGDSKAKPTQIISLATQIKSYLSTVLIQPHSTHRYFGELLNANKENIFKENSSFDDYYYSALLVNRISYLFKRKKISNLSISYKYHVALIVFKKTKAMIKKDFSYSQLIEKTNEKTWFNKIIIESVNFVTKIITENHLDSKIAFRSKDFTNLLLEKLF